MSEETTEVDPVAECAAILGIEHDPQVDFDDALARAFANIEAAKKDSENPHFRNKYADLASVTEAVKGPLTDEGFSWPQTIAMEEGMVIVTQWLRRKGVAIKSVLPMPVGEKATPQQIGSAITYARRYALSAMVGVAPDDDDGNAASSGGGGKVRAPRQQSRRQSKPAAGPWRKSADTVVLKADETFRKLAKQRAEMLKQLGANQEQIKVGHVIANALGVDSVPDYDAAAPTWTLDQWGAINAVLRAEVEDLAETLERGDDGSSHRV